MSRAGRRPCGHRRGRPGWHIECSAMIVDASRRDLSTSMAAASTSSSRITRTRSRRAAAPSARKAMAQYLDAQRLPAGRRREDVEEPRQLRHHPRGAARQDGAARRGRRASTMLRSALPPADRLDVPRKGLAEDIDGRDQLDGLRAGACAAPWRARPSPRRWSRRCRTISTRRRRWPRSGGCPARHGRLVAGAPARSLRHAGRLAEAARLRQARRAGPTGNGALRDDLDPPSWRRAAGSSIDEFERVSAQAAAEFEGRAEAARGRKLNLSANEIAGLIRPGWTARRVPNSPRPARIRTELDTDSASRSRTPRTRSRARSSRAGSRNRRLRLTPVVAGLRGRAAGLSHSRRPA